MAYGRNTNVPAGAKHTGWYRDGVNGTLEWYNNGTKVGQHTGSTSTITGAVITTTTIAAGTTVTAGTGVVATTGGVVASAGDIQSLVGNMRIGVATAFGTTQPVASSLVMKTGTAPAGTITTSGGIFTDGTTVKKIIADGTVSDVQT